MELRGARSNKIDVYGVHTGVMQDKTKELCKKDVTPPQPFLDFVHLFALEILNLISDHVIAYLTYLMTLFFIAFNFSMCENYPGKRPQTVFKGLFMKLMKIGDHIKLRGS